MPVFISESAFLRVGFPPERFGLGDGWEVFYDPNGNQLKKQVPHPAVKFHMGRAEVDEETAKRLREHDGFGLHFTEQPEADTVALANMQIGPSAALPPGGLTDKDVARLMAMEAMSDKSLAANRIADALDHMQWAVERFSVTGFQVPDENKKPKVIRARLVSLIDLLGEHGIEWNAEPESSNSGDGAGAS